MKIAVLISGRGSNLEALLNHQQGYTVSHVISNNIAAKGIATAKAHGVVNSYIDWSDKAKAESHLGRILNEADIELIVLAGFMRILSAQFVSQFKNRIINIHPSLLPKYPGLHTHQRVLENGESTHGATVHLVDDQLDHGLALAQTTIQVDKNDNADLLAEKLLPKEHKLLTHVVGLIAQGDLHWKANQLIYKQNPLTDPIMVK